MFNKSKLQELQEQLDEFKKINEILHKDNIRLVDKANSFVISMFSPVKLDHIRNGQPLYRIENNSIYKRWVWNKDNKWTLVYESSPNTFEVTTLGWKNSKKEVLEYCLSKGYFFSIHDLVK